MATARTKRAQQPVRRPEKKIGPLHSGLGVAIFLNAVETEQGTRYFRSIVLSPRRYIDRKTGQWKDAGSYRVVDLPTLLLVLESAHRYCLETPLPGQSADNEELQDLHVLEDGEIVANGDGQSSP